MGIAGMMKIPDGIEGESSVGCVSAIGGKGGAMHWSTNKPVRAGWYWWRRNGIAMIVYVYEGVGGLWVQFPDDELQSVSRVTGEWSDRPIEEPKEA